MGELIVTSIKVDKDRWKRLKKKAIDLDLTLEEAHDDALKKWLDEE